MDKGLDRLRSVIDGHYMGPLAMKAGTYEGGYCVKLLSSGRCIRIVHVSLTDMAENDDDALQDEIVRQVRGALS